MAEQTKKHKAAPNQRHPVKEYIGTIPIRKVNYISVYIDEVTMKKIARIILQEPSLSVAKVLAISGKSCDCCSKKKIMLSINGRVVLIPRGLLSTKKEKRGSNISTKKRKVHE